MPFLTF